MSLATLAGLSRWVAWQTQGRGAAGKPTKVPFAPDGRKAKADDPRSWGTRQEATARAALLPRPFGSGGIGLELGDHGGVAVGGIDLDSCRDPRTGGLAPWASAVIERFATYSEVSPSGSGVKLFFTYDPADGVPIRQAMGTDTGRKWARKGGDHPPGIELYISGRFFAVTDERSPGAPLELRHATLEDLEWLITEAGPEMAAAGQEEARPRPGAKKPGAARADGRAGDGSRSAKAFKLAAQVRRRGGDFPAFLEALDGDPDTAAWKTEKGEADGGRELRRCWERAGEAADQDVLLTEHGVASAFTQRYKNRLRYCHDAGCWFEWVGTHWRQDRKHAAFSFARQLVAQANREAEFKTQAITGKAAFAGGVEKFAQRDPAHAVTAEDWDRDPFLLATPGGVVDLRTGQMRPARPDDMMTRIAAVAPAAPGTEAPLWRAFLMQATKGDYQLIGFLKRWFGYCLTGSTREHALFFGYGPGGNGKSVLLNTVARILGDYAVVAAMETFTASHNDKHPTDLAMLRGARLVTATETEEGRAWAESRIKQMTGGDPVSARFMRQDFFTYRPQFKITIAGNNKPVLRNVDEAARRRFNIVPFLHKPEKKDLDLEAKLEAEWPAILAWMIDGCLAWQADGLAKPDVVNAATAEYFEAQDVMAQWLGERCILAPHLETAPSHLLKDFNSWADANGAERCEHVRFRSWAERQPGLLYKIKRGTRLVAGVGLRPSQGGEGGEGWRV